MKLLVEVLATFALIYWPAALMLVRTVLDDGQTTRFTSAVVPAVVCLPALLGLVFYLQDWTFLWFSAHTFLVVGLVLPVIAGALLGLPRALFSTRSSDAGEEGYTLSGRAVYYAGVRLPEADPSAFEILSARIGRDRRHVFRGAEVLIGAAPESFEVLEDPDYQRDARRVYYMERVIPGAEPASFTRIPLGGRRTRFWRDARSVYFLGKRIGLADVATFEPLTDRYARDEQRVFYEGEVIYDVDPATFEALRRRETSPVAHDARDQFRRYLRGKPV